MRFLVKPNQAFFGLLAYRNHLIHSYLHSGGLAFGPGLDYVNTHGEFQRERCLIRIHGVNRAAFGIHNVDVGEKVRGIGREGNLVSGNFDHGFDIL